jgi:hypothetical protein
VRIQACRQTVGDKPIDSRGRDRIAWRLVHRLERCAARHWWKGYLGCPRFRPRFRHYGAALSGGGEARFVHQSLYAQSSFGHLLLQQLYAGEGRSAARVFRHALNLNQRVYHYLPQHLGELAALSLPDAVRAPISAALVRGDTSNFVADAQTLGSWNGYATQIEYPAGLGGSSFVLGNTHAETGSQRQGASVSSNIGRAVLLTGLLGDDAPTVLINQWQGELDYAIGAGDGLVAVAAAPMDLGLTDLLIGILSSAVIDHVASGSLDPIATRVAAASTTPPVS